MLGFSLMQLSEEKIREVCLKTIARELDLPLEEVKLDSNLRDDLDLTSLDAMNVIMALEDEFGQEADIEQDLGTSDRSTTSRLFVESSSTTEVIACII